MIKETQKKEMLGAVRGYLEYRLLGEEHPGLPEDPLYHEKRGIFVTLHKKGQLRGCIGYIEGVRPLAKALFEMAGSAAFRDPRFPTLEVGELKDIEIPAAENCTMFLWTTHRFIWDAKELLDHWGFEYRAMLVWDKQKIGMGDLFRMQCEFCLVGIKGKPVFDNNHTYRDIFQESRREHSRKPEKFYDMVNELCVGRKLDYFSRNKREGWEVFGNETEKF